MTLSSAADVPREPDGPVDSPAGRRFPSGVGGGRHSRPSWTLKGTDGGV